MIHRGRSLDVLFMLVVALAPLAFGGVEPWAAGTLAALMLIVFANADATLPVQVRDPAVAGVLLVVAFVGLGQSIFRSSFMGPSSFWPSSVRPDLSREAIFWIMVHVAFFLAARSVFVDERRAERVLRYVFGTAVIIAVLGLVQKAQGNLYMYGLRKLPLNRDPFGPFYNKDHAAMFMTMGFAVGLGLLGRYASGELSGDLTPARRADSIAKTVMFACPVAVVLAGVYSTHSRAALAALVFASICGLAIRHCQRGRSASKGVVVPLLVVATLYALLVWNDASWVGLRSGSLDGPVLMRIKLYGAGLKMFADRPIFGVGLGAFREVFPAYQPSSISGYVEHIHSDWLELALEGGAFVAASAMFAAAYVIVKTASTLKDDWLSLGAFVGITSALVHSSVDFGLHIPSNSILLTVLIAFGLRRGGHLPERVIPAVLRRSYSGLGALSRVPVVAASLMFVTGWRRDAAVRFDARDDYRRADLIRRLGRFGLPGEAPGAGIDAALQLFDDSPFHPDSRRLFQNALDLAKGAEVARDRARPGV